MFISAITGLVLLVYSGILPTYGKTSIHGVFVVSNDSTINFEKAVVDNLQNGFTQAATGKYQKLNWKIVTDNGNKVAAQLAKNEGNYFNLLVLDRLTYQDFTFCKI